MLVPIILLSLQAQFWHSEARVAKPLSPPKNAKLLGGHDIDITEAPYQVSIQFVGRYCCGGALVQKDIVITAAACVHYSNDTSLYTVRAGSSNIDDGGKLYDVEAIVIHPLFKFATYNLAVVKLSTPVTFSDKVAAIPMKDQGEEVADGEKVQVTGWGITQEYDYPLTLQMVEVQKINWNTCVYVYDDLIVTPQMMCAGVAAGDKGYFDDDEGAPLVHNGKLAGVSDYFLFDMGTNTIEPDQAYTKVSALRSWIDQTIQNITTQF